MGEVEPDVLADDDAIADERADCGQHSGERWRIPHGCVRDARELFDERRDLPPRVHQRLERFEHRAIRGEANRPHLRDAVVVEVEPRRFQVQCDERACGHRANIRATPVRAV